MPAGAIDSDAVFDAAATKVQAILRGSKARKSVDFGGGGATPLRPRMGPPGPPSRISRTS